MQFSVIAFNLLHRSVEKRNDEGWTKQTLMSKPQAKCAALETPIVFNLLSFWRTLKNKVRYSIDVCLQQSTV